MTNKNEYIFKSNPNDCDAKIYRTELPNFTDDMGLTPYEHRLLVHYWRACGAKNDPCKKKTRTVAEACKMSTGQVSMARKSLITKGFIQAKTKNKRSTIIVQMIPGLWRLNLAYFLVINRPNIDGWTVQDLRNWVDKITASMESKSQELQVKNTVIEPKTNQKVVHLMNNSSKVVHQVNTNGQSCSPGEHYKKEHINKKEKKKENRFSIPTHNNQIHHTDLLGQPGVHYQNGDGKPVEAIIWKVMPKTVALTVITTGEQKTRVKPEGNLFYRNGDTELLPVVTGKEKEGVKLTDDEREMKDTLMDIIRPPGNFVALTEKQASDIQKAAINAVRKKIASPAKFKRYQTWWTEHNWKGRGGEPITLKNMGDHWPSFDKWDNGGQHEIVSTIPKEILELGKAQKKQLAERNG